MGPSSWMDIERYARTVTASLDLDRVQNAHFRAVRDVVPADAYGISLVDPDSFGLIDVRFVGVSESFPQSYEQLGRDSDPMFQRMVRTRRPVHDGMLLTPRASLYRDNLRGEGLRFMMQAPLLHGRRIIGYANFARSDAHEPFRQEDLERVMALGHYAGAAVAHALAHRVLRERCAAAESVVRATRAGVAVSTDRGKITVASRTLDRLEPGLHEVIAANARKLAAGEATRTAEVTCTWGGRQVRSRRVAGTTRMIVTHVLDDDNAPPRFTALPGLLTPREIDVFELVALGLRDAQIAARLFVSRHTVKQHLKSVYRKLGARSRTDALRRASALERPTEPKPGSRAGLVERGALET